MAKCRDRPKRMGCRFREGLGAVWPDDSERRECLRRLQAGLLGHALRMNA
jgi:hypothetical protein